MQKAYQVLKNQFPKELLNKFKVNLKELIKTSPSEDVFWTEDKKVKQIQNLHTLDPKFLELSDFIQNELGYKGEVMNMQYFIKPPNYKITAPHQDGAYFNSPKDNIVTFWIPLHEVNEMNSCMCYLPKTDKLIIPHQPSGNNVRTRTGATGLSQKIDISLDEFEPVPLKFGDGVMHDQFSIHYSSLNRMNYSRVAITCIIKLTE